MNKGNSPHNKDSWEANPRSEAKQGGGENLRSGTSLSTLAL